MGTPSCCILPAPRTSTRPRSSWRYGTGTSSEMDPFVAWLKTHRSALAARIQTPVTVSPEERALCEQLSRLSPFKPRSET